MHLRKLRLILLRISLLAIVFVAVFVGTNLPQDSPWMLLTEGAGYLFLLAGLAVRLWSILYVGGRKSRALVTEGPYSLCRNPLYGGTLLLCFGAGLSFVNPIMLAAGLLFVVPVHLLVIWKEEEHLRALFPDEYPDYMQRVPRIWPRLSGYRSGDAVTVSVKAIHRAALDATMIMLIPASEDLLEALHDHHLIPVLWRFP